jgi:uncharacterized lipoprotein NlpE involved in copper resistance
MKKMIISLSHLSAIIMIGCNNNSNEKKEQQRLDSIRNADSMAVIEQQRIIDSIASVAEEQRIIQDSIMNLVRE